jgi:hypothetical protein
MLKQEKPVDGVTHSGEQSGSEMAEEEHGK